MFISKRQYEQLMTEIRAVRNALIYLVDIAEKNDILNASLPVKRIFIDGNEIHTSDDSAGKSLSKHSKRYL